MKFTNNFLINIFFNILWHLSTSSLNHYFSYFLFINLFFKSLNWYFLFNPKHFYFFIFSYFYFYICYAKLLKYNYFISCYFYFLDLIHFLKFFTNTPNALIFNYLSNFISWLFILFLCDLPHFNWIFNVFSL